MKLIRIGCNHNSTCTKLENLDDISNQARLRTLSDRLCSGNFSSNSTALNNNHVTFYFILHKSFNNQSTTCSLYILSLFI